VDVLIAAVLFVVTGLTVIAGGLDWVSAGALAPAAVASGVVALRRTWPTSVFAVSAVAAEAYLATPGSGANLVVLAAPLVALYSVADAAGLRRALTCGVAAFVVIFALHALVRPAWVGPENVALLALGGLAIAAGEAARSRRAYAREAEERARQAELGLEQEAERRVTEERLRIARELHDVLGHHVALITVQAGAAADVLDDRPAEAKRSLTYIKQAGRAALDDLRDVVVLLRRPGDPAVPTEPAAGLAALDELIAVYRGSGLRIDREIDGVARPLPGTVDVVAYRVVQEALTNVAKHAGPVAVTVRLAYAVDELRIDVEDGGNGGPVDGVAGRGDGHGIAGMRERVAAVDGELTTGSRPGGGFRVRARLPLTRRAAR
jgi:signal transduction histidine kinase